MATIYVLSKNKKNITVFSLENYDFDSRENCSVLHGHVFVMSTDTTCCVVAGYSSGSVKQHH